MVAQTKDEHIYYPSFEVEFSEQFQIHLFTLPSKIELEIVVKGTVIDKINLIIPGGHVESLTSASMIIKEYQFSRNAFNIEK